MAKTKTPGSFRNRHESMPAMSPEARENYIIAKAYDLAEQRILDGTASAQEITYFLKAGSQRNRLELEILELETELTAAKTEALKSQKRTEELYANALEAMRSYSGQNESGDEDTNVL